MIEPDHWLWRLDEGGWIAAADAEWQAARANAGRRRTAIAHCRRAGGMALNAVLVANRRAAPQRRAELEAQWGRSYVDHLRHVAAGDPGPLGAEARAAAAAILATPMAAPALVVLAPRAHADIDALLGHTRALLDACAAACHAHRGV